jgi:hypothetical protein
MTINVFLEEIVSLKEVEEGRIMTAFELSMV